MKSGIMDEAKAQDKADQMNAEAQDAKEERRHLEMMAATITAGIIADGVSRIDEVTIAGALREAIKAAQIIRDEQEGAGTRGKA
jgi:hypothetical protein